MRLYPVLYPEYISWLSNALGREKPRIPVSVHAAASKASSSDRALMSDGRSIDVLLRDQSGTSLRETVNAQTSDALIAILTQLGELTNAETVDLAQQVLSSWMRSRSATAPMPQADTRHHQQPDSEQKPDTSPQPQTDTLSEQQPAASLQTPANAQPQLKPDSSQQVQRDLLESGGEERAVAPRDASPVSTQAPSTHSAHDTSAEPLQTIPSAKLVEAAILARMALTLFKQRHVAELSRTIQQVIRSSFGEHATARVAQTQNTAMARSHAPSLPSTQHTQHSLTQAENNTQSSTLIQQIGSVKQTDPVPRVGSTLSSPSQVDPSSSPDLTKADPSASSKEGVIAARLPGAASQPNAAKQPDSASAYRLACLIADARTAATVSSPGEASDTASLAAQLQSQGSTQVNISENPGARLAGVVHDTSQQSSLLSVLPESPVQQLLNLCTETSVPLYIEAVIPTQAGNRPIAIVIDEGRDRSDPGGQQSTSVHLSLNTENLGSVSVDLTHNQGISCLFGSTEESAGLIQGALPELRDRLTEAGLRVLLLSSRPSAVAHAVSTDPTDSQVVEDASKNTSLPGKIDAKA